MGKCDCIHIFYEISKVLLIGLQKCITFFSFLIYLPILVILSQRNNQRYTQMKWLGHLSKRVTMLKMFSFADRKVNYLFCRHEAYNKNPIV